MALETTNYHYRFIHNVFADFYKSFLDYINFVFDNRFHYSTVSTYAKFVRYIKDQEDFGREIDGIPYSAVVLDPVGELNLAETTGKFTWRFPQFGKFISKLLDPIYMDNNVKVTVGTSYVTGEMQLTMIFDSIYEYLDSRFLLLQIFRGMNQIINPIYVNTFITLPDEVFLLNYQNEYTGTSYTLDWLNNGGENVLIKSLADNYNIFPLTFRPKFKMTGMSDGSKKYGGTDDLTEYRLVTTINFETNVPSFLCVETDHAVEGIDLSMEVSGVRNHTRYLPEDLGTIKRTFTSTYDNGLVDGTNSDFTITDDTTATIGDIEEYEFNVRYYHQVTELESDSTAIDILVPENIDNSIKIILKSESNGYLEYSDDYSISGNIITLLNDDLIYVKDEIIELFIYKKKS